MGRTVLPYSNQIDMINDRLKDFRRALRKDEQELFDRLILQSRKRVQAGVMMASPDPFHAMFLSILIAMQKEIDELKKEIKRFGDKMS